MVNIMTKLDNAEVETKEKDSESLNCNCEIGEKQKVTCLDSYLFALTLIKNKNESDFYAKYNTKHNGYLAVVRYYILNKDNKRFQFKNGGLDLSTMSRIFFFDNIEPNPTTIMKIKDTGFEFLDGNRMPYLMESLIKHILTKLHSWDKEGILGE